MRRFILSLLPFFLFLLLWQSVALLVEVLRGVPFPTPWQTLLRLGRHSWRLRLDGEILISLERIGAFLLEQRKIDRIPDFIARCDDRFIGTIEERNVAR